MLAAFGAVSVSGLEMVQPANPIAFHSDSIETDEIKDASPQDKAQSGDRKDSTSDKKGDQEGKAKKDGKNQGNESEYTEPEVSEDQKDQDGDIDGLNENDEASDDEGDGETAEETPFPGDNEEASIATDLRNQTITVKQLKEDTFGFYAYIINPDKETTLKVKIRNDETSLNGRTLKADGKNFKTKLAMQANYITLYLKKNNEIVYQITYKIDYISDKADEDNQEIGEHPPTIKTNLDGRTKNIKNRNFIFTVSAKTYRDEYLTYDSIRVSFDGKTIKTTPTGMNTYEYDLYFDNPRIGDTEKHKVTVLAWDNEGNSRFKAYTVTYEYSNEGDVIGTVTVNVDATTIGLGMVATGAKYEIKQDEPAAAAVIAAMEEYGFTPNYSGSVKTGFYLRGLSGGYIANGAKIPSTLKEKIKDDGLNMTGQHNKNRIAEFDYTEGSGWMYTVDGSLYPGRGLSSYYLEDGDVLTLRFTLAYGKDLGAHSGKGLLSSYCGKWINGKYTPSHTMGKIIIAKEATCTEDGVKENHCKVKGCREVITETIKALGHDFMETSRTEATTEHEGEIVYTCKRCGETKTEVIPKKPDTPEEPTKPTEPTAEPTDTNGDD
ncbi:MAG: hypothetical protein Q4A65_04770 [Bacillota bacterium]|nr:hypothetical protein [Bacillota bacterium]